MEVFLLGLQSGAQYALLSVAVVLVFNATGIVNFAVGAIATAGVYVAAALSAHVGSVPLIITGAVVCIALVSMAMETIVSRPIERRFPRDGREIVLIALILVFVVVERVIVLIWGPAPIVYPSSLVARGTVDVFGTPITKAALLTYVVTSLLLIASAFLLQRTRVGVIVRAIAEDERAVVLAGVETRRYVLITWAYAGVLAAIAGLLLANTATASPAMASSVFIKAVAGAALGGLTSPFGAAFGALAIGLLETFTAVKIDPGIAAILPMVAIFLILVFRPSGLFGRPDAARV